MKDSFNTSKSRSNLPNKDMSPITERFHKNDIISELALQSDLSRQQS